MLMNVSDLNGRALNWAVAYVDEGDPTVFPASHTFGKAPNTKSVLMAPDSRVGIDISEFDPSGNWAHGGPIIAAAKIESQWDGDAKEWQTTVSGSKFYNTGKSILPSAMRTFVYEVAGMEIEIPDELCEVAPCK